MYTCNKHGYVYTCGKHGYVYRCGKHRYVYTCGKHGVHMDINFYVITHEILMNFHLEYNSQELCFRLVFTCVPLKTSTTYKLWK